MYEIVVVGTSLGGLKALRVLLRGLAPDFPLPVVVVQHRHRESDDGLTRLLAATTALPVSEAEDKQPIAPAAVYVAPADYHLLVEKGRFVLSTEGPVRFARPSVDVLFESAADAYGAAVAGVILTGSNTDGAHGAVRIIQRGGLILVEDPSTAECPTMPQAAIAAVQAKRILPLDAIAGFLSKLCPPRIPEITSQRSEVRDQESRGAGEQGSRGEPKAERIPLPFSPSPPLPLSHSPPLLSPPLTSERS